MADSTSVPASDSPPRGRWISLWIAAALSLLAQLQLCGFFTFGRQVPLSIDINPCNLWKFAYPFPPRGEFLVLNWLGLPNLPQPLNPFSLAAHLPPWIFFSAYAPALATAALLAMAGLLRELDLPRPAALFGGLIYAWQGDLLPFVFPGHFGYIATWAFFALAAWAALRAERTGERVYVLLSGLGCGVMVGLQPDRGAIASLLVAALYLAPASRRPWNRSSALAALGRLTLCALVALGISLAAFLALFKTNIVGVKLGGEPDRAETYKLVTQYSLGPEETLTYLAPGLFGWWTGAPRGDYWGRIGQWPDWPAHREGLRNLNLAISTTGTVGALLALLGALVLLPGRAGRLFGPADLAPRQLRFGRLLLGLGVLGLVLAWGYHTPLYRPLFALPLMDKWRNPLKWLEWTNLAAPFLAALGLRQLFLSLEPEAAARRGRLALFLGGATALLLFGWLLAQVLSRHLILYLFQQGYAEKAIPDMAAAAESALLAAALFAGWTLLLAVAAWNVRLVRAWRAENPWVSRLWQQALGPAGLPLTLTALLALLAVGQLRAVAGHFLRPVELTLWSASNPLLEKLRSTGPQTRVAVDENDPVLNTLLQYQFLAQRLSSVNISAASRIPDDWAAFTGALERDPARFWFLTGVRYVAAPPDWPVLKTAGEAVIQKDSFHLDPSRPDEVSHVVATLRDYLPKASFIPEALLLDSNDKVIQKLTDSAWNPNQTLLLEQPSSLSSSPSGTGTANLLAYDSRDIQADVTATAPGYLLIDDQFDPDWRAEVNGQPAALLRADAILRAVPVPAGNSTVHLHYAPTYTLGPLRVPVVWTDGACDLFLVLLALGCVALLIRNRFRPKHLSS